VFGNYEKNVERNWCCSMKVLPSYLAGQTGDKAKDGEKGNEINK
jgi:hypothetical protein